MRTALDLTPLGPLIRAEDSGAAASSGDSIVAVGIRRSFGSEFVGPANIVFGDG